MGIRYKHVTIEERCEMARLHSAGHSVRQIAASLDRSPSTVARELKRNGSRTKGYEPVYADQQSVPVDGAAHGWSGMRTCETGSSLASNKAGLQSRLPGAWLWSQANTSSPTRPSTGLSTPSWRGLRITPGATICPGASRNEAGAGVEAAVRLPSSISAGPLPNVPRTPPTVVPPATGRPT